MEKKHISTLTDEDLLKNLEQLADVDDDKILHDESYKNDVLGFIHEYKLQSGDQKIHKKTLYRLYRYWSEEPVEQNVFTIELSDFIEHKNTWYFINKDIFTIKHLIYQMKSKRLGTKIPSYKKHFDNFIKKFEIISGNFYVNEDSLYYLYDKWTKKTKIKNNLRSRSFRDFLNMYFSKKLIFRNDKNRWYYGVNREITKYLTKAQLDDPMMGEKYNKDVDIGEEIHQKENQTK